MGVGLYLCGKSGEALDATNWFREVWSWVLETIPEMAMWAAVSHDADGPHIKMQLHPAAQPVDISVTGTNSVLAIANTNSVGPGYHIFICDLLDRLGEKFRLEWSPDSNEDGDGHNPAFFSKNSDQAYEEMLLWVHANAVNTAAILEQGCTNIQWAMPSEYLFDHDMLIATCMGPRGAEWLQSVIEDPMSGADIFPWWNVGYGAEYLLGKAIYLMWTEVRWRSPLDEAEANLQETILHLLAAAYKIDTSLAYPWYEWSELSEHCEYEDDLTDIVRENAAVTSVPRTLIGYRRRYLTTEVGGWRLRLPGSCADHYDDETGAFMFWDEHLHIQLVSFEPGSDGAPVPMDQFTSMGEKLGELVQENSHGEVTRRIYTTHIPDDEGVWRFSALLIVPDCVGLIHVLSPNQGNIEWAIDFFNSITHSGSVHPAQSSIGDPARRILSDLQAMAGGHSTHQPADPEHN